MDTIIYNVINWISQCFRRVHNFLEEYGMYVYIGFVILLVWIMCIQNTSITERLSIFNHQIELRDTQQTLDRIDKEKRETEATMDVLKKLESSNTELTDLIDSQTKLINALHDINIDNSTQLLRLQQQVVELNKLVDKQNIPIIHPMDFNGLGEL